MIVDTEFTYLYSHGRYIHCLRTRSVEHFWAIVMACESHN